MITQRLDDRDQFTADMERLDDEAVNKYAPLIGIAYPDREGRTITILDVDASGRALLEREGQAWGCEAEYLTDLLPAPASAPTNYTRRLCYRHACQEFDKLSNMFKCEAAHWRTVEPDECELCNLPTA